MLALYLSCRDRRRQCTSSKINISLSVAASLISFFPSLDPPGKTILSTAEEISTRLLKLHVPELNPANIFSVYWAAPQGCAQL